MDSIIILCIILLSLTLEINGYTQEASYFRLTTNAMIPVNKQTNSSLIAVISDSCQIISKRSCLLACNRNQNCDLVAFDLSQNVCRLYKKTPFIYVSSTIDGSKFIYDKFLNDLWNYCDQYPYYVVDSITAVCYYYDPSNYLTWSNANNFCASMGLSLLIIDTAEKLTFSQSLNQNIWVGSQTTTLKQFSWLDGSAINSAYWASGQPDNGGITIYLMEACLFFQSADLLADTQCSNLFSFVCQIE